MDASHLHPRRHPPAQERTAASREAGRDWAKGRNRVACFDMLPVRRAARLPRQSTRGRSPAAPWHFWRNIPSPFSQSSHSTLPTRTAASIPATDLSTVRKFDDLEFRFDYLLRVESWPKIGSRPSRLLNSHFKTILRCCGRGGRWYLTGACAACVQDQGNSDGVLDDIACMLGCTRSSLNGEPRPAPSGLRFQCSKGEQSNSPEWRATPCVLMPWLRD